MRGRNNVDKILTREPERDPWSECDEATEDTGNPSKLTWGRGADDYFAAAHRIAAELRQRRRQRRDRPNDDRSNDQPPPNPAGRGRVGWCGDCNRNVVAMGVHHCAIGIGWRGGYADGFAEALALTYYDDLASMKAQQQGNRKRRTDIRAEWRPVRGYPNYLLHSVTRKLWRQSHEIALKNGGTRKYPAREVPARNGSFSLTVNGETSSRGINALWSATFHEYAEKKTKKPGESTIEPRRNDLYDYAGLAEWVAAGSASVRSE